MKIHCNHCDTPFVPAQHLELSLCCVEPTGKFRRALEFCDGATRGPSCVFVAADEIPALIAYLQRVVILPANTTSEVRRWKVDLY